MADTKLTCGINTKNIKDYLAQGMTEDEIAAQIAKELNTTFSNYKTEKAEQEKKEKARLEKEYAVAQARATLIQSFKNYLTSLGYEIKGDFEKTINNYLNKIEKMDFSFDALTPFKWFDWLF